MLARRSAAAGSRERGSRKIRIDCVSSVFIIANAAAKATLSGGSRPTVADGAAELIISYRTVGFRCADQTRVAGALLERAMFTRKVVAKDYAD
jgi:hypothetical protein